MIDDQAGGHRLRVRIYDDRIECLLGSEPVLTLPRGRWTLTLGPVLPADEDAALTREADDTELQAAQAN